MTPLRFATPCASATWPDGAALFTPLVCVVLMIYYVFAMQCMSTVAVVKRETNSWRWPLFQVAYMTGTAWLVCSSLSTRPAALSATDCPRNTPITRN
jgi:ferrous iron transport protein B